MKKFLVFIVTISMLFTISCAMFSVSARDPIQYHSGELSYEEYTKKFAEEEPQANFVFYEDIKDIGNYKSALLSLSLSKTLAGFDCYDCYHYLLTDASSTDISVNIFHLYPASATTIDKEVTADKNDLRNNTSQSEGGFVTNGITYSYAKNGKLKNISFVTDNGLLVLISGSYEFGEKYTYLDTLKTSTEDPREDEFCLGDYPENADTLIGRLLNTKTNAEASKELLSMFNGPEESGCGSVIATPISALSALAVACGAVVIRKRRK